MLKILSPLLIEALFPIIMPSHDNKEECAKSANNLKVEIVPRPATDHSRNYITSSQSLIIVASGTFILGTGYLAVDHFGTLNTILLHSFLN
jgi:hypothetical protein